MQKIGQVSRYQAIKSSSDLDCQFKLDLLGCAQPLNTGNSEGDVNQARKAGDQHGCSIEDEPKIIN